MATLQDSNGNVGENAEEAEGVPDLFREKIREAAGKQMIFSSPWILKTFIFWMGLKVVVFWWLALNRVFKALRRTVRIATVW